MRTQPIQYIGMPTPTVPAGRVCQEICNLIAATRAGSCGVLQQVNCKRVLHSKLLSEPVPHVRSLCRVKPIVNRTPCRIQTQAMVSDDQIRPVCARALAVTDPEELEQLLAGLRMLCTQYLRERSIVLAYSNPCPLVSSVPLIAYIITELA
jgi:hypothetical protein